MKATVVVLSILLSSSIASADRLGGVIASFTPGQSDGGGGLWLAGDVGPVYVGGEITVTSYAVPNDNHPALSYQALVGVRSRLSRRTRVAFDVGAGIMQEFTLNVLGSGGYDTVRVMPSSAARLHLVGDLGKVNGATFGVALTSEARFAYASMDAGGLHSGFGLGLGLFVVR